MAHIVFIDIHDVGECVEGYVLGDVRVYIFDDTVDFGFERFVKRVLTPISENAELRLTRNCIV